MDATKRTWRNRIVRDIEVDPQELLTNPKNWRAHPNKQKQALSGVLREYGLVQRIIIQEDYTIIDGHLRVALAIEEEQPTVPASVTDLEDWESNGVLATLDPLAAMAATDSEKLDELLRDVQTGEAAVQEMLSELAETAGSVVADVSSPDDFASYGDDIETDYCCPKCGYEWSGQPK